LDGKGALRQTAGGVVSHVLNRQVMRVLLFDGKSVSGLHEALAKSPASPIGTSPFTSACG